MSTKKELPVCKTCGSDNVQVDAYAEWDRVAQDWVLSSTYDDAFCQVCEESTKLDWITYEDKEKDDAGPDANDSTAQSPDRAGEAVQQQPAHSTDQS